MLTLDGLLRAKLRVDPSCGAGVDLDVDIPRISVDLAPRTIAFLMDYGFGWAEALRKLSSSSQVASTLPSLSKSFVFGSLQSEDLLLLQRRLQLATSADKDGQSVEFSNRDLAAIIQLLRKVRIPCVLSSHGIQGFCALTPCLPSPVPSCLPLR